jgi:hypothetical protein
MPYEPKLTIETQYWPAKRGVPRPTLSVAVGDLFDVAERQLGTAGAAELLDAIADVAETAEASEADAVESWRSCYRGTDEAADDGYVECDECGREASPPGIVSHAHDPSCTLHPDNAMTAAAVGAAVMAVTEPPAEKLEAAIKAADDLDNRHKYGEGYGTLRIAVESAIRLLRGLPEPRQEGER